MFGRRGNEASLSKTSLGNSRQCEPVAQSVLRVVMWVFFRWCIVKKKFSGIYVSTLVRPWLQPSLI